MEPSHPELTHRAAVQARLAGGVFLVLVLFTGCSGSETAAETTEARATTATVSPAPLQVSSWGGREVRSVCLEVRESYQRVPPGLGFSPVFDAISEAFDEAVTARIVATDCDARMEVIATGTPLSAGYTPGGTLFTGAEMTITMMLSADGAEPLSAQINRETRPPDSLVLWEGSALPDEPQDAPFWSTIEDDICATFADWFEGSPRGGDITELLHNVLHVWSGDSCGGYDPNPSLGELLGDA